MVCSWKSSMFVWEKYAFCYIWNVMVYIDLSSPSGSAVSLLTSSLDDLSIDASGVLKSSIFFFFFFFFFAAPMAIGSSRTRDQTRTTAATQITAMTVMDPYQAMSQRNSLKYPTITVLLSISICLEYHHPFLHFELVFVIRAELLEAAYYWILIFNPSNHSVSCDWWFQSISVFGG